MAMASASPTGLSSDFDEARNWASSISKSPPTIDPDTFFSVITSSSNGTSESEDINALFSSIPAENCAADAPKAAPTSSEGESLESRIEKVEMAARLKDVQDAYDALRAEHREIRLKYTLTSKELSSKSTSLEESWNASAELEKQLKETQNDLGIRETELSNTKATVSSLEQNLVESSKSISKLQSEIESLKLQHSEEIENLQKEHAAAKAATAEKVRTLEEHKVAAIKGSLESDYETMLKDAVARERESWEKRHKSLLQDYKELEPRYKAVGDSLQEKLAALEFDNVMIKADKEKLKNDVDAEKAKVKALKKTLKKTRAECIDIEGKLGTANQLISTLKEGGERNNIQIDKQSDSIRGLEHEISKLQESLRKANAIIAEKQTGIELVQAELSQKTRANEEIQELLSISRKEHNDTKSELMEKVSTLSDLEDSLAQTKSILQKRETSLKDVEQTLETTMKHLEEQQNDLVTARNESASLAAISASGALSIANASSTVSHCCRNLQEDRLFMKKLSLPEILTRTAKIARVDGEDIGIELSVDFMNNNPGIRISGLRPESAATRTGLISVGDVIVAINDVLVIESSLDEVKMQLMDAGDEIVLGLASGDEIDDDDSAFWQIGGEDSDAEDVETTQEQDSPGGATPESEPGSSMPTELSIVNAAGTAMQSKSRLLSTSIGALQDVTTSFNVDLNMIRKRTDLLVSKLSVSRRKASSYFTMHHQAVASLTETHEKLDKALLELAAATERADEAERDRDDSANLVTDLGAQLSSVKTQAFELELKLGETEKKCQELLTVKAQTEMRITDLTESEAALKDTSTALTNELEAVKKTLHEVESVKDQLSEDLETLTDKNSKLTELQDATAQGESALSKELVKLSGEVIASQEEVTSLSTRLSESEEAAKGAKENLDEALATIKHLEESVQQRENQIAEAEQERLRIDKLLQEEERERLNLEAGLGEAINALANASEATAKVSVLEKRLLAMEAQEAERVKQLEDLRVQEQVLSKELQKEQENFEFAQGLLTKAGDAKTALEQEIDELKTDNSNVRELLHVATQELTDIHHDGQAMLSGHQKKHSETVNKLYETEAALASERSRIEELESLFSTGLLQQESLETRVNALSEQIRALGAEPAGGSVKSDVRELQRRNGLIQATDNIIKVFRTFGIVARNVVISKPREGGIGIELCHDPSASYKGVVISSIRSGGVADQSNQMRIGDHIICVNGKFVLESSYEEVIRSISESPSTLSLVLGSAEQMLDDDVDEKDSILTHDDGADE